MKTMAKNLSTQDDLGKIMTLRPIYKVPSGSSGFVNDYQFSDVTKAKLKVPVIEVLTTVGKAVINLSHEGHRLL